jgi:hypothetical protein
LPYEEEGLIPYAEELKGVLFKTLTVFIAASSGLTVAGIFIWKEQKQIKEQKKNDFEILEEH